MGDPNRAANTVWVRSVDVDPEPAIREYVDGDHLVLGLHQAVDAVGASSANSVRKSAPAAVVETADQPL